MPTLQEDVHDNWEVRTACSLRNDLLATGGDDGCLRLWRDVPGSGRITEIPPARKADPESAVCAAADVGNGWVSSGDSWVLSGHRDGSVRLHATGTSGSSLAPAATFKGRGAVTYMARACGYLSLL